MVGDTGESDRAQLDLALASAATLLSQTYDVPTELEPPIVQLDIVQTCETIAKLGSPPLRFNVARDLATAGYEVKDLKALLRSLLPSDSDGSDQSLEKLRQELIRRGPTVNWPGYPPGHERGRGDPVPPDKRTRDSS